MIAVKSVDIEPYVEARRAYEQGVTISVIQRRYRLTDGEAHDVAPEEFEDDHTAPEGIGGY